MTSSISTLLSIIATEVIQNIQAVAPASDKYITKAQYTYKIIGDECNSPFDFIISSTIKANSVRKIKRLITPTNARIL